MGDWDGVAAEGDRAAAGDLSLANLPAEAKPNALLAAGCCCSGVVGSDDIPGLLDDNDLRKLLSGVCHTAANSLQIMTTS